ncbi:MAG: gamma-glutamylcyclotransferase [Burkholderiaceae bacterium]|nr:gamma-glutamylcyclotransferase [Burkholderiaceae bacterium]
MPEASCLHVFVYGTLRKGQANDITLLSPPPGYVGTGTTPGALYQLGWYPGLVLGGESRVVGEVYLITAQLERRLDEIEEIWPEPTNEYFKRLIPVEVEGALLYCIVYEINPERIAGKPLIASGDWLERD